MAQRCADFSELALFDNVVVACVRVCSFVCFLQLYAGGADQRVVETHLHDSKRPTRAWVAAEGSITALALDAQECVARHATALLKRNRSQIQHCHGVERNYVVVSSNADQAAAVHCALQWLSAASFSRTHS